MIGLVLDRRGLPVTQSCPVQGSPCLTCSHLRTTMEFLDVHKKRLEETEKLIENARANGWDRQIETNLPIADNLKKIIRGLEQKEVIYGDESFPEQNGGEQKGDRSSVKTKQKGDRFINRSHLGLLGRAIA
ncbi:MAG: hypothetical protein QNJ41_02190 [Xenococcaceae cyanobacterium MO_188.B32]|nr:hypothetical protein [Xenococcaceae cyanobacterium MO_188.B32]